MFKLPLVLALAAAASAALASPAAAQGPLTTAFTYQGELRQGGNPADGLYDMRFGLYDALVGGTQQGAVQCSDNVNVIDGRFTASIDFGTQYNGQRRFLEVEVRLDSGNDCSTESGYVPLAPRQELAAVPHALFALGTSAAANATQLNGQAASFYTNASNLSSGTLSVSRLPMPLSIAGNPPGGNIQEIFSVQSTNADYGVGIKSTAKGIGLISTSTGTTGFTYGGQFFSGSSDGTALLAHATSTTGTNVGISAKTSSTDGVAITAQAEHPTGGTMGVIGSVVSPQGIGVYGLAPMRALFGQAYDSGGRGIETMAPADGYAGYFNGRGYFSDKVGMGTNSPVSGLHVVRNWDGEEGAMRLEGDRPTLRLTGGSAAGNHSWMMHVGSDGPGNLGLYRRTAPASWTPVMTLSPNGNIGIGTTGPAAKLEVAGGARFTGVAPFHVDMFNGATQRLVIGFAGAAGHYSASAGFNDVVMRTSAPQAAMHFQTGIGAAALTITQFNDVGVGTTNPLAKLHVYSTTEDALQGETSSPDSAGIYGKTTASQGDAVLGVAFSGTANGVHGRAGLGAGVQGVSYLSTGSGVGVRGQADSPSGFDFYAAGAGTNYGSSSSRRWKNNVVLIEDPLAKLNLLRGVYFDWDRAHGGHHDVGMIAEEVGAVMPEIVNYETNGIDAIGMDYSKLTPLLVEAVNALRAEKDAEIHRLKVENQTLQNSLRSLERRLSRLESDK